MHCATEILLTGTHAAGEYSVEADQIVYEAAAVTDACVCVSGYLDEHDAAAAGGDVVQCQQSRAEHGRLQ